ncbi:unnamed protein product [marine sediment metagenome]|uniref:C_GCAxxG_C_C family protein n=2 Tax=marine sediment metagenome TaxID=412755 RepID=X1LH65_9ZZZZ
MRAFASFENLGGKMNKVESAVSFFNERFNCCQSVLLAYCEEFGLDRQVASKISTGFGGGMGRMAGVCGVVTGAFMVLGLKYGKMRAEDNKSKEKTYVLVKRFAGKFEARHDSIICKDILGCDISTPQGLRTAREEALFSKLCPKFVQDAAEILEEMLRD